MAMNQTFCVRMLHTFFFIGCVRTYTNAAATSASTASKINIGSSSSSNISIDIGSIAGWACVCVRLDTRLQSFAKLLKIVVVPP